MTLPEHESPRAAGRRSEGRSDWSSWPKYEAAALGLRGSWWYPVMWSSQVRKRPVGVELLGRKIVFFRDAGTVSRAARSLPASRRPAFARLAAVPRHAHLRLPRLDVRPGDRRVAGGDHRRAGLADLRKGVGRDIPGGRAPRDGVDLPRRRPRPAATRRRRHPAGSCASTPSAWAGASTSAAVVGATRPRTASTRDMPSTCIARRCGGCSR